MSGQALFTHELTFVPAEAEQALRALPVAAGVVALFGHQSSDRPHLLQSANLRRRLQRLLQPADGQTRRLNLRDRIARIAWRETHSMLEGLTVLHRAMVLAFGEAEARRRMRLLPPFTVRYAVENRFPRIYVTSHLRRRSLATTVGPFASRLAADRYREAVEELFTIRRCFLELHPSPDDPGCIYGEMKKCMAPCQERCTDGEYNAEAKRALHFLQTRGLSHIRQLESERDAFSSDMLFEEAAAAHTRVTKARETAAIADPLVGPLDRLRTAMLVPGNSSNGLRETPVAQLFLYAEGTLRGPETISLLGVRLAREQAQVGSSLFAQPRIVAAVPEDGQARAAKAESSEESLLAAIARLQDRPGTDDMSVLGDNLAMLRRWYYRPEKQREGLLFHQIDDTWPVRKMLRDTAKLLMDRQAPAATSSLPPQDRAATPQSS